MGDRTRRLKAKEAGAHAQREGASTEELANRYRTGEVTEEQVKIAAIVGDARALEITQDLDIGAENLDDSNLTEGAKWLKRVFNVDSVSRERILIALLRGVQDPFENDFLKTRSENVLRALEKHALEHSEESEKELADLAIEYGIHPNTENPGDRVVDGLSRRYEIAVAFVLSSDLTEKVVSFYAQYMGGDLKRAIDKLPINGPMLFQSIGNEVAPWALDESDPLEMRVTEYTNDNEKEKPLADKQFSKLES